MNWIPKKTNIRKKAIPMLREKTNSVLKYKLAAIPVTKEKQKAKKYRLSSLTDQLILSECPSLLITISPSFMILNESFLSFKLPVGK